MGRNFVKELRITSPMIKSCREQLKDKLKEMNKVYARIENEIKKAKRIGHPKVEK